MVDYAGLSRLRPRMPAAALVALAGPDWDGPDPRGDGSVFLPGAEGFTARVDTEGRLGRIAFFEGFPPDLSVEGVHLGMPIAQVMAVCPCLRDRTSVLADTHFYGGRLANGLDILVITKGDTVQTLHLEWPGSVYPAKAPARLWSTTAKAYDLAVVTQPATRDADDNHGWCFGLPPGLRPEQWPLDPRTGQPLRHAFTLKLPPDHRVKGPALVAVSLFGTDWSGDTAPLPATVAAAWDDPTPPDNRHLDPVWLHRTRPHPHEYRIIDSQDEPFAVIWLSAEEFAGPLCPPPVYPDNPVLGPRLPAWTRLGALAVGEADGRSAPPMGSAAHQAALEANYALRWQHNDRDPNAGMTPPEGWDSCTSAGYQSMWTPAGMLETAELQPWAEHQPSHHIGGTMFPVQAHPSPGFSPFYVEFAEELGGFNFGGGTGQLDLDQMRLDWACG